MFAVCRLFLTAGAKRIIHTFTVLDRQQTGEEILSLRASANYFSKQGTFVHTLRRFVLTQRETRTKICFIKQLHDKAIRFPFVLSKDGRNVLYVGHGVR